MTTIYGTHLRWCFKRPRSKRMCSCKRMEQTDVQNCIALCNSDLDHHPLARIKPLATASLHPYRHQCRRPCLHPSAQPTQGFGYHSKIDLDTKRKADRECEENRRCKGRTVCTSPTSNQYCCHSTTPECRRPNW